MILEAHWPLSLVGSLLSFECSIGRSGLGLWLFVVSPSIPRLRELNFSVFFVADKNKNKTTTTPAIDGIVIAIQDEK